MMIHSRIRTWILASSLLCFAPGIAGNVGAFEGKRWLTFTGMLSKYQMTDVNNGIEELGIALLGGVFVDEVPVGLGFGLGLGLDVNSHVALGVAYDRYTARTSGEGTNSDLGTGRVEIAMSLPANAISGSVELRHHGGDGVDIPDEGRWSVGAGVSGGVIWTTSELRVTSDSNGVETTTYSGTGPLVQGFLAADIWQSPRLGFGTTFGYRFAKVENPDVTTDGTGAPTPLASIDYSGIYLQVGIKFAL